jgi:parallel beta-helix repeat protein
VTGGILVAIGLAFFILSTFMAPSVAASEQAYVATLNISLETPDDARGQRLLAIRHTGGDTFGSFGDLKLTVAPPDGDPMYPVPVPIEHDGIVTFTNPGDLIYVYLRTDCKMVVSNAIPAYTTFMDLTNGRWRVQIDDGRVHTNIATHTALVANSMTYPVAEGYSIRSGIKNAVEYGTIFVYGSLYKERLEIDRPLRLISTSQAILDGGNRESVIQVKANGVTIDGFEIKNSGNSNFIDGGIVVHENADGTIIRNNVIHHCSNAIWLWGSDSAIIQNNTLYRNDKAGILMEGGSSNNYVKYNTAYENMYGILLTSGEGNTINENVFHDNSKYAIVIEDHTVRQNICEYNDFGNDKYDGVDMAVRKDVKG